MQTEIVRGSNLHLSRQMISSQFLATKLTHLISFINSEGKNLLVDWYIHQKW